ncbi:release factor glutamine methyltransferase [Neorhizobium huautlense]|uniref:Release factor glutamine methyltransferase n=1 Tax=Neorhizobium huautlense TaxID=67774 RepID=A0ABT9Q164_9HYPH|nr:peptide chain release factor N(5)-glutamine methyltransferase [Neorhizobium huautlense]MDP9840462.1 release factor glutamine methyltransferase [Neorhizobium huautlense]
MKNLAEAVMAAKRRFAEAGLADAAFEARYLVGGLLGLSNTEVFTGGDRLLTLAETAKIADAIERRLRHEPVHRIIGARDFHGLTLKLSKETLEPRPDTETLVEALLPHAQQIAAQKGAVRLLDMGTGTGAIALALVKALPQLTAIGSDISRDALDTAGANAHLNGVADRFSTRESRWFDKIEGCFDIIVSNPPYIRSDVIPELQPDVRDFDPLVALDGGPDGLDAYRDIADGARAFLEPGGWIGLEIGYDQKETVAAIFEQQGFALIDAVRDYGGNDRVLLLRDVAQGMSQDQSQAKA